VKKLVILLMISVLFAVETTGAIKIIKKNGSIYFIKNDQTIQIKVKNTSSSVGGIRSAAFAVSEHEESDLPVELFGLVAQTTVADSSGVLMSAKNPANVNVAVIDTGLDTNNSYLRDYCLINTAEIPNNGKDDDQNGFIDDYYGANILDNKGNVLDDHGHGTSMYSMVAIQSKGNVKIIPIKAFDSRGCSSQFLIANAIVYAVQRGADIINCSFGYPYSSETLQIAIQYALDNGVIVVAAAGNNGQESVMYPAGFSGVIAVSSLDDYDRLSYFSNFGEHIRLSCVGEGVSCIGVGGTQQSVSGTSISSAFVAGAISNINNLCDMDSEEVVDHYTNDVVYPLGAVKAYPGWDKYTGQGKIASIEFSGESTDVAEGLSSVATNNIEITNFLNYPNPVVSGNATEFGFYLNKNAVVDIRVYSLNGKEIWKQKQNVIGGGTYHKISYDLTNEFGERIGNDSYLAVVKASDGNKVVTKKTIVTVLK